MGTQRVSPASAAEVTGADESNPQGIAPAPAAPLSIVSTRASRTWVKVLPALVLLAVLMMFVFQNLGSTKITFATASGAIPLALALLGAAALGALSVLVLGSVRILQLRKVVLRHRSEK
jgi:uncharacterized integral membrane protein